MTNTCPDCVGGETLVKFHKSELSLIYDEPEESFGIKSDLFSVCIECGYVSGDLDKLNNKQLARAKKRLDDRQSKS